MEILHILIWFTPFSFDFLAISQYNNIEQIHKKGACDMIEALGKSLKESRIHYGITQNELAKKLQVSQSTYAGYETGKSTPSIETLWKLADIYGTPVDLLIGRYHQK